MLIITQKNGPQKNPAARIHDFLLSRTLGALAGLSDEIEEIVGVDIDIFLVCALVFGIVDIAVHHLFYCGGGLNDGSIGREVEAAHNAAVIAVHGSISGLGVNVEGNLVEEINIGNAVLKSKSLLAVASRICEGTHGRQLVELLHDLCP